MGDSIGDIFWFYLDNTFGGIIDFLFDPWDSGLRYAANILKIAAILMFAGWLVLCWWKVVWWLVVAWIVLGAMGFFFAWVDSDDDIDASDIHAEWM